MKRFLVFIIIILGILFLFFALIFFFKEEPVPKETSSNTLETPEQDEQKDKIAPVSRIVSPEQGITVRKSFKVEVQEADAGGSGLLKDECRYSVYDCGSVPCTPTVFNAKRSCNDSFWVFVGKDQNCFSQGKAICRVLVSSKDYAGNSNSFSEIQASIATFGVDFVFPEVFLKQPSFNRDTLFVSFEGNVTDNVEISNCQIIVDKRGQYDIIPLVFSPILCEQEKDNACYQISGSHTFASSGVRNISLSCWDLAGNTRRSKIYTMEIIKNRVPQISFCRVMPTSGSSSDSFVFQAEATDLDQDTLSYQWNLGDEILLSGKEVSYQYSEPGVYRPEIIVKDSFGAETRCFTAWVVVE